MILKHIALQNFRSFAKSSFNFASGTTVIVGPNTSGKTNLLEAVYLLSTGKSFRANVEEEMIRSGSDLARVIGLIEGNEGDKVQLEVMLTHGQIAGERVGRKKLIVNKIAKRLVDYQGNLRVVLFGPWDMNLITDAPSTRRKFLDNVLSQVDREYRRSLLSYEKGLRQRNKILEHIREEGVSRSQLLFWDKLLIKNGDYLSEKREEFIEFANSTPRVGSEKFQMEYDRSAISEARLSQYAEEEVAAAATLVGPHRDDIVFVIRDSEHDTRNRNLAVYGSRGEQRMCILWVKLAELAFIETHSTSPGQAGDRPVLLLDDIFSELDHRHREVVMGVIDQQQTILTTADPHTISGLKNVEKIELGEIAD